MPRHNPNRIVVQMAFTRAEYELIERAANETDHPVATWARLVAIAAADRQLTAYVDRGVIRPSRLGPLETKEDVGRAPATDITPLR